MTSGGSSPLARGTLLTSSASPIQQRLIPACAGNTYEAASRPRFRAAHPRLRGEHPCGIKLAAVVGGSSPLARGTRYKYQHSPPAGRLIPACAGNTDVPHQAVVFGGAHPRLRGEHGVVAGTNHREFRLIPACAGNTQARARARLQPRAHPRLRGEHIVALILVRAEVGSSPLARGTRQRL